MHLRRILWLLFSTRHIYRFLFYACLRHNVFPAVCFSANLAAGIQRDLCRILKVWYSHEFFSTPRISVGPYLLREYLCVAIAYSSASRLSAYRRQLCHKSSHRRAGDNRIVKYAGISDIMNSPVLFWSIWKQKVHIF